MINVKFFSFKYIIKYKLFSFNKLKSNYFNGLKLFLTCESVFLLITNVLKLSK